MHVSNLPDYWENINKLFFEKYYGIDECHQKWKETVLLGNPIVGPLGREWLISPINKYGKINWTQFTNYPVQGTGADIMAIARVSFMTRLRKLGLEKVILLISSVHDSIVVDSPKKYLGLVTKLFEEVFSDLQKNIYKLFQYEWKTPLACEVKYGSNMRDIVKVTNVT